MSPPGRVVRVLPDVPAIDKQFDYFVPEGIAGAALVRVGTVVRIDLHGRRVGGWVVEVDVAPDPAMAAKLRPIAKITGLGPPAPVVDLARWAAWRWAGRWAHVLRFATPDRAVRGLPPRPQPPSAPLQLPSPALLADDECADAFETSRANSRATVFRFPPCADLAPLVLACARTGGERGALIVTPSVQLAVALTKELRAARYNTALLPEDWSRAAAGGCVAVGARAAVWSPQPDVGAVLVVDEHDESMQDERAPTWHARDVAIERARRTGVPCVLASPMPTLEATSTAGALLRTVGRSAERGGWPVVEVIDRSGEDPARQSLLSERLTTVLRVAPKVVCVLNRTGRARLLACGSCGELARCEVCGATMTQPSAGTQLECQQCAAKRPLMCGACGTSRLKNVRMGVSRAREEIEALAMRPTHEVTAAHDDGVDAPVLVGTEAVLHRVRRADAVVFLDFDSELLAPRYRAAEQALAMIVRAGRLVGGRASSGAGRVILQTRAPQHEVVQAALLGDPERLQAAEAARRAALRLSPVCATALLTGAAAATYAEALRLGGAVTAAVNPAVQAAVPAAVDVSGPAGGPFLVRAADHAKLCDALAATARPTGRLRIEVDPLRT